MTAGQVRVGILGAGTIAGVHAANLHQMPEASLVAVADADVERAAALAGPRGAAAIGSLDNLLALDALDAVLICLPPFATAGVATRPAKRDLHLDLDFSPERLTGNAAWEPIEFAAKPPAGVTPHGFSGRASWYLSLPTKAFGPAETGRTEEPMLPGSRRIALGARHCHEPPVPQVAAAPCLRSRVRLCLATAADFTGHAAGAQPVGGSGGPASSRRYVG